MTGDITEAAGVTSGTIQILITNQKNKQKKELNNISNIKKTMTVRIDLSTNSSRIVRKYNIY